MNKEQYVYFNGLVIIEKDGKKELFPHYEGFEKILSQENLVEKIYKEINGYQKFQKKLKGLIITLIVYGIIISFGCYTICFSIKNIPMIVSALLGIMGIVFVKLGIKYYINARKNMKATKHVLFYLEETLKEENEYLIQLQEKEKKYTESQQKVYEKNISSNQEDMDAINEHCNLYYDYILDRKKIFAYV